MDADLPFSGAFRDSSPCLRILDARAPLALWVSDTGGRVRPLHPGFLELSGIRLEEGPGTGWHACLDDLERAASAREWLRCRQAGSPWEREFRLRDAAGRARHVLSRGMPARDAAGRVQGWVGLNLDVTDVREGEGEVRRFRERVLLALCAGGDYLYEIDPGAGTRRWFGPVSRLLGGAAAPRPEPAAAWMDAVIPEDRSALAAALATGGDYRLEYRLRRADGTVARILDRGRALPAMPAMPEKEGGRGYLIGIVTELTESRWAAGDTVPRDGSRRHAGAGMEVMGRLAGGIAHDFNNLLTAINGFSELLADGLEDGNQRGYALEILRAGERAALITRQLLAFSRRQIRAPRVLDLNAMVRGLGRTLPALVGEGLEVTVRADPQGAVIKADPAQVEQLFLNLASHARGERPGGGRIAIEIGRAESTPDADAADAGPGLPKKRDGPYVVLAVQVDGEGLSEEEQARLFEPFFLPNHGRPQGLGLSAVYGIVKQNGGHIVACSRPGEGTAFRIHWPRWLGAESPAPIPANS